MRCLRQTALTALTFSIDTGWPPPTRSCSWRTQNDNFKANWAILGATAVPVISPKAAPSGVRTVFHVEHDKCVRTSAEAAGAIQGEYKAKFRGHTGVCR